ncbi:MAG: hypothetical protein KG028_04125 [Actinobacteria bacterium]|jgi:hypothetical protein|nr:hypothetical protein [Actinomycetota bacterium]
MDTRTTRVATDLLAAAEVEARRESRSAREQLDHWARVGMHLSARSTAARRRIERAIEGDLDFEELTDDEREIANAELSVNISRAANEMSFADRLAAEGVTTVVTAADGKLVERRPDGTTTAL